MLWESVFHEGELAAQRRVGEERFAEINSPMISKKIPSGALNFILQQCMVILTTQDVDGKRWTSLVFGPQGFLKPLDRQTLQIALPRSQRDLQDPLWANLRNDTRAGVLLIELASRRRIRINGDVTVNENELVLRVTEAFGICPKYITRRNFEVVYTRPKSLGLSAATGSSLTKSLQHRVHRADMLFIGTGHTERGHDASHRGGNPGFIEVIDGRTLRIPDFRGNSMFNSLGNLLTDPTVGVLIPFLEEGRQLQFTGVAQPLFDQPDPDGKTGGTHRFLEFRVERWIERPLPASLVVHELEYSPFNPK